MADERVQDQEESFLFKRALSSPPFRFLVGTESKEYYVQADLVAHQSPSLARLVDGPWAEAENRCARLEAVDEDTFAHFVEFAYSKDYTIPKPEIDDFPVSEKALEEVEISHLGEDNGEGDAMERDLGVEITPALQADGLPQPIAEHEPPAEDVWAFALKSKIKSKTKKKRNSPEALQDKFRGSGVTVWTEAWEPATSYRCYENYARVFLCHARLYVFADTYDVHALRDLTLQRLRLTLTRFVLCPERVQDVVELIKYVCTNTVGTDDHYQDPLRDLILEYTNAYITVIGKDPGFRKYMQEDGVLGEEIMCKLLQRLDYAYT